ncbi:MAG TPA: hypothetical protein PLX79_02245 [Candidatus Dojkabacteria bacterium]|nr:hypothetical protein [Candidatus Dojkabacteria bacterium]
MYNLIDSQQQQNALPIPTEPIEEGTKRKISNILSSRESHRQILEVVIINDTDEQAASQQEQYLAQVRRILSSKGVGNNEIESFVSQLREIISAVFVEQDAEKIRGLLDQKIELIKYIPLEILLLFAATCINTDIKGFLLSNSDENNNNQDNTAEVRDYMSRMTKIIDLFSDETGRPRNINIELINLLLASIATNMEAQFLFIFNCLNPGLATYSLQSQDNFNMNTSSSDANPIRLTRITMLGKMKAMLEQCVGTIDINRVKKFLISPLAEELGLYVYEGYNTGIIELLKVFQALLYYFKRDRIALSEVEHSRLE